MMNASSSSNTQVKIFASFTSQYLITFFKYHDRQITAFYLKVLAFYCNPLIRVSILRNTRWVFSKSLKSGLNQAFFVKKVAKPVELSKFREGLVENRLQ